MPTSRESFRKGNFTVEVEVNISREQIEKFAGGQDITRALEIIGQVGQASAMEHAPVDTGTLRRSITYELGRRGMNQYVRIGTNIFYAIFQEIGTRYHPAHPYLRPAMADIEVFLRR